MSKKFRLGVWLLICGSIVMFAFADRVKPGFRGRWIFDFLGPEYFPWFTRFLAVLSFFAFSWMLADDTRSSKRARDFARRNSMLEIPPIVESNLSGPDTDAGSHPSG